MLNSALKIRDAGIDPKDIERIFDPYYTTKEFGKGTGMGLALVHGILKSHGGSISLDSAVGRGTTISAFFPAIEGLIETTGNEKKPELLGGHERILVVDDEISLATLSQRRLERLGYAVEIRTDPGEALRLVKSDPDRFDLVITDMAMPHMSGGKLAEEILQIRPDIPIILCTGFSDRINEEKAVEMGIQSFLMKPVDMKCLADKVRHLLDEK